MSLQTQAVPTILATCTIPPITPVNGSSTRLMQIIHAIEDDIINAENRANAAKTQAVSALSETNQAAHAVEEVEDVEAVATPAYAALVAALKAAQTQSRQMLSHSQREKDTLKQHVSFYKHLGESISRRQSKYSRVTLPFPETPTQKEAVTLFKEWSKSLTW